MKKPGFAISNPGQEEIYFLLLRLLGRVCDRALPAVVLAAWLKRLSLRTLLATDATL